LPEVTVEGDRAGDRRVSAFKPGLDGGIVRGQCRERGQPPPGSLPAATANGDRPSSDPDALRSEWQVDDREVDFSVRGLTHELRRADVTDPQRHGGMPAVKARDHRGEVDCAKRLDRSDRQMPVHQPTNGGNSVAAVLGRGDGAGPSLHRHPYPELFIVHAGEAEFEIDDARLIASDGNILIAPAGSAHRFTNTRVWTQNDAHAAHVMSRLWRWRVYGMLLIVAVLLIVLLVSRL
jgi:mannose-6-phosphate isomerase-like protein (cupin superfamily)